MSKGKSPVVIHVADDVEDDLFEEAIEPHSVVSNPKQGDTNLPGPQGDEVNPSDGKGQPDQSEIDQPTLVALKTTSAPDAGCSNSAHISFTLSGAFCESLGPMTSAQLRTLSDEQMVAVVPLFSQIDETFREVVCSLPMTCSYFFLPLPVF